MCALRSSVSPLPLAVSCERSLAELLVDQQGAGGVKIEHIGVLFAAEGAVFVEKTGVLGTERCLHI